MSAAAGIQGFSIEDVIHEIELNLWETWSNFGRGPGCTLHDESDALWFETPIPVLPYNTVLRFQQVHQFYRPAFRNNPSIAWTVIW